MKQILLVMCLMFVAGLFAFSDNELEVLRKTAKENQLPVKSFIKLAEQEKMENPNFDITNKKHIEKLSTKFDQDVLKFAAKITLVGMLVVFLSLIITGMFISNIKHFSKTGKPQVTKKKEKVVKTSIGEVKTSEGDLSTNSVVVVITAIHLHLLEVEAKNKINMDWRRAPVSMWKSVSKAKFPNQDYKLLSRR